eukprot:290132-Rhodomonas_salina.2
MMGAGTWHGSLSSRMYWSAAHLWHCCVSWSNVPVNDPSSEFTRAYPDGHATSRNWPRSAPSLGNQTEPATCGCSRPSEHSAPIGQR